MSDKLKGPARVEAIRNLAAPIAESLGLKLWDVKIFKEGGRQILRIVIDKDGGVSMDDCVAMHRAIDAPLDELDPIEESYNLQISSPGLEREIERPEHFEEYIGENVKFKLRAPIDGKKEFSGVLKDYNEGLVIIEVDGEDMSLEKKDYAWIKLDDFPEF
ncbi:MAG TPA: ribosome maturation factor RimP [Clostridiales bacterium]|nr:ribosome maturation factor RimP [Clostridiales bacterium]HOJ35492.1 ribosome maturation factor RimP [Clostridiales bacterium]HPP67857.1 ribosome maturation factor RimP [Clostridiales bacterium]HPU67381.1 ribosome maturation factor RimP [Clostridiales bacterium]HQA06347.1 ribosome maturation factor RimP [Clostridiales bacterium]